MFRTGRLSLIAIAVIAILALSAYPISSSAQASGQENPMLFSPSSEPYGMTYGEWTAIWWQWFLSMPTNDNPINDQTGELCDSNQDGPVWLLVGSGGGQAKRSCEIPAGKAILIPAIIVECSYAEDSSLTTEADLRACAKSDQDLVSDVWATINGVDLPDEDVYRVDSPLFDFTFIANNVISAPEGPTQAVSDGFWLFLKPLPPGSYELRVGGLLADYTVTSPITFVEDSTYRLTITAPESYSVQTENASIADEPVAFTIGSSSELSNITFDEQAKQLSFTASEGIVTLSISSILEGPYTVMVNGEPAIDYGVYEDRETGETKLALVYEEGTHETAITGTNVVPEFPLPILFLIAGIMTVIIIGKTRPNLF
jgi:hypothetical protein